MKLVITYILKSAMETQFFSLNYINKMLGYVYFTYIQPNILFLGGLGSDQRVEASDGFVSLQHFSSHIWGKCFAVHISELASSSHDQITLHFKDFTQNKGHMSFKSH